MQSELELRLHNSSKECLIHLLNELATRHPILHAEMESILESLAVGASPPEDSTEDSGEEITEDWDFSGDDQAILPSFLQPVPVSINGEAQSQRIEEYTTRLKRERSPQVLANVLTELIEEAISHIGQNDYEGALDLFALLFDERLHEHSPALTVIFDELIDAATPSLEALLGEASSSTFFNVDTVTLSPLLTQDIRHGWLERLFALWLKRLDAHRVEEDLPEIMIDVAWNEDMLLLRNLAQNELQKQPHSEHSNIVDFTSQYRARALEKFLKVLSQN